MRKERKQQDKEYQQIVYLIQKEKKLYHQNVKEDRGESR